MLVKLRMDGTRQSYKKGTRELVRPLSGLVRKISYGMSHTDSESVYYTLYITTEAKKMHPKLKQK